MVVGCVVVGPRLRAVRRVHAVLQPPGERELHDVPHHREAGTRPVRVRAAPAHAGRRDLRLHHRPRRAERAAQLPYHAALLRRRLDRRRDRRLRPVAAPPRPEHARAARHRGRVPGRVLLLLGQPPVEPRRIVVGARVLHPPLRAGVRVPRDGAHLGVAPASRDRRAPERGRRGRHRPVPGRQDQAQPQDQRGAGTVEARDRPDPRPRVGDRGPVRSLPDAPQPVLAQRTRSRRSTPLRGRPRRGEPRHDRPIPPADALPRAHDRPGVRRPGRVPRRAVAARLPDPAHR